MGKILRRKSIASSGSKKKRPVKRKTSSPSPKPMRPHATLTQFKRWARKSPNFMTPDILASKQLKDNKFAEMSEGEWMKDKIYGVSIIKAKADGSFETGADKRNRAFGSKSEAEAYYNKLQ